MPKYKIAFFDIDGTLSDPKKRNLGLFESTPASARRALDELRANNIIPVIATGRNKSMVENAAKELKIDTLITSNGHMITHKGEVIYCETIPTRVKDTVAQYLNSLEIEYVIESIDQEITVMHNKTSSTFFNDEYKSVGDANSYKALEALQFVFRIEDANKIKLEIPEIVSDKVATSIYNVHSRIVSKATSIEILLETLKIPRDMAIAFGDEENDIDMFSAVGFSVCMGNGNERLKEIASYITDDVDKDGIYNACVKLGLID